jgi:hypothetical protein
MPSQKFAADEEWVLDILQALAFFHATGAWLVCQPSDKMSSGSATIVLAKRRAASIIAISQALATNA